MRFVDFQAADSSVGMSVLGFGCAALMGRVGRRESLIALGAALDAGITFFDTARSYGYGDSEGLLGEFLGRKRREAIVCTKFGIVPAPRNGWKQRVKPLAQVAVRAFPALRSVVRQQAAGMSIAGQFTVDVLSASIETSLRELRTDYIDILLLHAAPMGVLEQDDLLGALERLVEEGKVRMAGISAELPVIEETFQRRPRVLQTAQFAVNLNTLRFTRVTAALGDKMLLVGNHPFGGASGVENTLSRIRALTSSNELPVELRAKLDLQDPVLLPEVLLNVILRGTGISAVVPAMMRPENLRRNAAAVERCRFSDEELHLLREALMEPQETGASF